MNQQQIQQFEQFWAAYPRRIGKGAARRSFERALRLATFEDIMTGLNRQSQYYASKEAQFIPHPTTWLNQERWSDDPQPIANQNQRRTIADAANDFNARYRDLGAAFGLPSIERH